jgi:hypothetical protein
MIHVVRFASEQPVTGPMITALTARRQVELQRMRSIQTRRPRSGLTAPQRQAEPASRQRTPDTAHPHALKQIAAGMMDWHAPIRTRKKFHGSVLFEAGKLTLAALGGDHEKAKEARDVVKSFTEGFAQTRIYFTGDICETMLTADNAMGVAIDLYATSGMVPWGNDKQLAAMNDMRQRTAKARETLEREFRLILGVVKENPANANA